MRALLLHYAGHEIDKIFSKLTVQEATDYVILRIAHQVIFACHSQSLRRRALREDLNHDQLIAADRALEVSEKQTAGVEAHTKTVHGINFVTPTIARRSHRASSQSYRGGQQHRRSSYN